MATKQFDTPHKDGYRHIPEQSQNITIDKLRALLPAKTNVAVTEEILTLIHNMETDTGLPQELLEEDLMSYMHLLGGMKGIGLKDLVKAIKYCNLKRNYDNKEAWAIVFPDKYDRLVANNMQIDNHVSMYTNSKLVVAIDSEMLIPVHITYAPYFHSAVKELYKVGVLGNGGTNQDGKDMTVSPMVKVQALKELAALTKQPEESKLAITVNPSESAVSMQEEMNSQLTQLVNIQKQQLDNGVDILEVQNIGIKFDDIIDAEVANGR